MDTNMPYTIVEYDENTSLVYYDDFEKENIKFIFGEISKFKDHYISILYEEPFFNEEHWLKKFNGEEIGSWKTTNEKDALDKLTEEFNYSFNFFHRQNIVSAMKYLKDKKRLLERFQNYCHINEMTALNMIYWKVEHKINIEKVIKTIESMLPNEDDVEAFMTKIQFVSLLAEKLKK